MTIINLYSYCSEQIVGFDDKDLPILNNELRKQTTDIRNNATNIATNATNIGAIVTTITGEIRIWTASSIPSGWLLCNGQSLSTTTYADLFAVIGYEYGGSGANFNVPNLAGKVVVGYDSADGDFDLKDTGGAKEVTLDETMIPSHTHDGSSDKYGIDESQSSRFQTSEGSGYVAASQTITIGSTGGGLAHENMPPYLTLNYIIKT